MVARAGREFAVAHGAQLPAERLLGDRDAELLEDPLREVDQPPAHHAVDRRDRAALDHLRNSLTLGVIELGWLAWRLAVQETSRPPRVEPQHPVPNDLETDTADLRDFCPRRALVDRGKCQQSPSLRAILRLLRQPAQPRCVEISSKRYRHDEPPAFATLNQTRRNLGIAEESRLQGLGIMPFAVQRQAA